MMTSNLIAIDCDGVLLDYSQAYRLAWHKAFGVMPELVNPDAYWPYQRWGLPLIKGSELAHFKSQFDEEFWSNIPALDGARDACNRLVDAGFELVCVSAVLTEFRQARETNLRNLCFPIADVYATPASAGQELLGSPKAYVLDELQPVAFVDDFAPYFRGIPADIHAALISRYTYNTPNVGDDLALAHSVHGSLKEFAEFWIARSKQ